MTQNDAGPEGVAGQADFALEIGPGLHQINGSQRFLVLQRSLGVLPLATPDAAEVEPHGNKALLDQSERQGQDHVVVHGPAVQRVGMTNNDTGPGSALGVWLGDYALEGQSLGLERNGALSHGQLLRVCFGVVWSVLVNQ